MGVLTTLRRDGSLHSRVVWVDVEDGRVEDEYPSANPDKRRLKVLIQPARVESSGFD